MDNTDIQFAVESGMVSDNIRNYLTRKEIPFTEREYQGHIIFEFNKDYLVKVQNVMSMMYQSGTRRSARM